MGYVLPSGALDKLDTLRDDYEKIKDIDLSKKPASIGLPTLFGGTDEVTRKAQLMFLKKIKIVLKKNLYDIGDIENPAQAEANLTASRAMIASCLFIQSQISGNSTLDKLINQKLGINSRNSLEYHDKELCFLAANRIFHQNSALEEANAALRLEKQIPFTEQEWNMFTQFLKENCDSKKSSNPYINYPVTSITQPLFGTLGRFTGQSIGVVTGDFLSHSSTSASTSYQLTAFVGSSLLVFGPAGPTGVAGIFGTIVAGKLVNTFYKITLGHILGVLMSYLGQAIGITLGLPLDLAYKGVCAVGSTIMSTQKPIKNLSGLRIGDGLFLINGLVCQLKSEAETRAHMDKKCIKIDEEGYICINGQRAVDPGTKKELPPLAIDDFQLKLKLYAEEEQQDVYFALSC